MAQQRDDHMWQPERLERLRDLLNSETPDGFEQQRALDVLEREMSERSAIGGLAALERGRRDFETHLRDHESPTVADALRPHSSPTAILRATRRRPFRPSQRLLRHREAYNDSVRAERTDSLASPRRPTPPFGYNDSFTDHYLNPPHREREHYYRAKRRKLDDGTFDDESKVVSYGDKGRVTPGPLRMEIVSCDGGEYDEPPRGMAQHVLQDDSSVYSTKSNRCNMILKHVAGAPFSLTRIVFRAPRDGYDAPVQEGMLFIAMDDENLLEKTSQYEVRYSPKSYRHHYQRRHDSYRPSQEYMNSTRSPLRSIDRSRYLREPYASHHPWLHYGESIPELETALIPGFEVSFSDPSDSEDLPSQSPLSPYRWRNEDNSRAGRSFADQYRPIYADELGYVELSGTSDDSEPEAGPLRFSRPLPDETNSSQRPSTQHRVITRIRATESNDTDWRGSQPRADTDGSRDPNQAGSPRRSHPARVELRATESTHQPQSLRALPPSDAIKSSSDVHPAPDAQATSSDALAPHARFFIHKHKSAIAVNFDPPVSGRYILIKLWAACPNANIDIQSIIAHGYGGPRFFPAQDLR